MLHLLVAEDLRNERVSILGPLSLAIGFPVQELAY